MVQVSSTEIMERTEILKNAIPSAKEMHKVDINGRTISMYIADVTSEKAKELVEVTNIKNRGLSNKNIRQLKREMENGNWLFAGNPVKFDKNGRLLDGQHRLIALSRTTNLTIKMLFITGLDESSFKVMDTGKKRTAGDVFSIEGVSYPQVTATAVKFVDALENGSFRLGESALNRGLTNTEAYEKYLKLTEIDEYVSKAKILNKDTPKLLSDPIVAGFWYAFSRINREDADDFMEKLIQGTNLTKNSPIKIVRDKLFAVALNDVYKMKRMDKNRLVALAWKKYRAGEEMEKLIIPKSSKGLRLKFSTE